MTEIAVPAVINGVGILSGSYENQSEEWYASRRGRIGGSEIAAIVGLSPWESRYSLWWSKRAELAGEKVEKLDLGDVVEWGTRVEPAIYGKYVELAAEQGYAMTTGDSFNHRDYPWMNANPDGLVWEVIKQEDGSELLRVVEILEIKTSVYGDGYGKSGTNIIPIYYRCQILWYMHCLGVYRAHLVVLIGGYDFRTYEIVPEEGEIEYLVQAAEKFMYDLEHDIQPNIYGDNATYQLVRSLDPEIDANEVCMVDPGLAEDYRKAVKGLKAAESEKLRVDALIMDMARSNNAKFIIDESGTKLARRQRPAGGSDPYLRSMIPKEDLGTNVAEAAEKVGKL